MIKNGPKVLPGRHCIDCLADVHENCTLPVKSLDISVPCVCLLLLNCSTSLMSLHFVNDDEFGASGRLGTQKP